MNGHNFFQFCITVFIIPCVNAITSDHAKDKLIFISGPWNNAYIQSLGFPSDILALFDAVTELLVIIMCSYVALRFTYVSRTRIVSSSGRTRTLVRRFMEFGFVCLMIVQCLLHLHYALGILFNFPKLLIIKIPIFLAGFLCSLLVILTSISLIRSSPNVKYSTTPVLPAGKMEVVSTSSVSHTHAHMKNNHQNRVEHFKKNEMDISSLHENQTSLLELQQSLLQGVLTQSPSVLGSAVEDALKDSLMDENSEENKIENFVYNASDPGQLGVQNITKNSSPHLNVTFSENAALHLFVPPISSKTSSSMLSSHIDKNTIVTKGILATEDLQNNPVVPSFINIDNTFSALPPRPQGVTFLENTPNQQQIINYSHDDSNGDSISRRNAEQDSLNYNNSGTPASVSFSRATSHRRLRSALPIQNVMLLNNFSKQTEENSTSSSVAAASLMPQQQTFSDFDASALTSVVSFNNSPNPTYLRPNVSRYPSSFSNSQHLIPVDNINNHSELSISHESNNINDNNNRLSASISSRIRVPANETHGLPPTPSSSLTSGLVNGDRSALKFYHQSSRRTGRGIQNHSSIFVPSANSQNNSSLNNIISFDDKNDKSDTNKFGSSSYNGIQWKNVDAELSEMQKSQRDKDYEEWLLKQAETNHVEENILNKQVINLWGDQSSSDEDLSLHHDNQENDSKSQRLSLDSSSDAAELKQGVDQSFKRVSSSSNSIQPVADPNQSKRNSRKPPAKRASSVVEIRYFDRLPVNNASRKFPYGQVMLPIGISTTRSFVPGFPNPFFDNIQNLGRPTEELEIQAQTTWNDFLKSTQLGENLFKAISLFSDGDSTTKNEKKLSDSSSLKHEATTACFGDGWNLLRAWIKNCKLDQFGIDARYSKGISFLEPNSKIVQRLYDQSPSHPKQLFLTLGDFIKRDYDEWVALKMNLKERSVSEDFDKYTNISNDPPMHDKKHIEHQSNCDENGKSINQNNPEPSTYSANEQEATVGTTVMRPHIWKGSRNPFWSMPACSHAARMCIGGYQFLPTCESGTMHRKSGKNRHLINENHGRLEIYIKSASGNKTSKKEVTDNSYEDDLRSILLNFSVKQQTILSASESFISDFGEFEGLLPTVTFYDACQVDSNMFTNIKKYNYFFSNYYGREKSVVFLTLYNDSMNQKYMNESLTQQQKDSSELENNGQICKFQLLPFAGCLRSLENLDPTDILVSSNNVLSNNPTFPLNLIPIPLIRALGQQVLAPNWSFRLISLMCATKKGMQMSCGESITLIRDGKLFVHPSRINQMKELLSIQWDSKMEIQKDYSTLPHVPLPTSEDLNFKLLKKKYICDDNDNTTSLYYNESHNKTKQNKNTVTLRELLSLCLPLTFTAQGLDDLRFPIVIKDGWFVDDSPGCVDLSAFCLTRARRMLQDNVEFYSSATNCCTLYADANHCKTNYCFCEMPLGWMIYSLTQLVGYAEGITIMKGLTHTASNMIQLVHEPR